jgi:hypothetical protein
MRRVGRCRRPWPISLRPVQGHCGPMPGPRLPYGERSRVCHCSSLMPTPAIIPAKSDRPTESPTARTRRSSSSPAARAASGATTRLSRKPSRRPRLSRWPNGRGPRLTATSSTTAVGTSMRLPATSSASVSACREANVPTIALLAASEDREATSGRSRTRMRAPTATLSLR